MPRHYRTCNLCEATCGITIETEGRTIVSIEADPADPLSAGHICPKAYALKDVYEDEDRIRRPMIRDGEAWREVSWDEAIACAAAGLHAVQCQHGPDALATYVGNPTAHNLPAGLALPPFLRMLGTHNRFSASSVDQFPKMLSVYLMFGAQLSVPVPDVDRTDYLLVIGANPVVSNGSLMTAPGIKRRLRAIRQRGGRIVVIDPRRTETAEAASEHWFVRPGSDPLLLMAMLSVVFEEGLARLGAAEGRTVGLEALRAMVLPFTPERVSDAVGIDGCDIRRIAREFCAAPGAACYTRIGTCVQKYGTLVNWLGDALNVVSGNLDRPGGVMFPHPAASYSGKGSYKRWKSRVRGLNEFGGELPVACLAEEIETAGAGQVRGLFTMAGNPVLSTPNGTRLESALASLEFVVSVDPALNETTRFANVVLPPRNSLENVQYSLVFHKLAVRDTAKFTRPVFEPEPGSWSEWEILAALTAELIRLRSRDSVAAGGPALENPAAQHFSISPELFVEMLLGAGPYGISLADIEAVPSGIDLGALKQGGIDHQVRHEDGKIQLIHEDIQSEASRLAIELDAGGFTNRAGGTDEFFMIGRRQMRTNNSWMHNCRTLIKGPERCTLLMHPDDAARLRLQHGDPVTVTSRVGSITLPLHVSDGIMRGVVSVPHGYGHTRRGTRMRHAAAKPGVSMNDVTDESVTEGLCGNAILTAVRVSVNACGPASGDGLQREISRA